MKHTTTITGLLAATILSGAASAGISHTYFGSYGGHDYYTTDLSLEYYDARQAAEELGASLGYDAYLASVTSEAESDWVQSISLETMWIGLNDLDMDGIWAWDSGEAFDWSDWAPGEPNENTDDENVVVMNWVNDDVNGWNDWKDLNRFAQGLIEVAVPAPGALALLTLAGFAGRRRRRH